MPAARLAVIGGSATQGGRVPGRPAPRGRGGRRRSRLRDSLRRQPAVPALRAGRRARPARAHARLATGRAARTRLAPGLQRAAPGRRAPHPLRGRRRQPEPPARPRRPRDLRRLRRSDDRSSRRGRGRRRAAHHARARVPGRARGARARGAAPRARPSPLRRAASTSSPRVRGSSRRPRSATCSGLGDVVGQSFSPEVWLSRDIGACYAGIYLIVNYGEGVVADWSHDELKRRFSDDAGADGPHRARRRGVAAARRGRLPLPRAAQAHAARRRAIVVPPAASARLPVPRPVERSSS